MNSICIAGNVARDAEVRYLPNGDAVAGFSVADNMGKDKGAIFWSCSLFGKRAESLSEFLRKGQAVTITGTVSEREWTDKDGQKRKSMDVRVQDVALQGGKREGEAKPAPTKSRDMTPRAVHQQADSHGFDDMHEDPPF